MSKTDPNQLNLPFGQAPPLAAKLRSIAWQVTGMSEHCWRQVREICIAVAYCGSRDGCYARRETLQAIANEQRAGGSPELATQRSFDRRHKQAVDMGLLELTKRFRSTALRRVNVDRVDEMLAASRDLLNSKEVSFSVASHCHVTVDSTVVFSGGSKLTTTKPTLSNFSKTKNNERTYGRSLNFEESENLRSRCSEVKKAVDLNPGRELKAEDRELCMRAVALEHFGIVDLDELLVSTKRCRPKTGTRWAYFRGALKIRVEDAGHDFHKLMREIEIPARKQKVFK